jgi:superfamily I DNA and/or RNA helicase
VVILSLVRSRADGNIGFLRLRNRINVLLSRAKHGMYLLGNAGGAYLYIAVCCCSSSAC